jgi:hypothetical protein
MTVSGRTSGSAELVAVDEGADLGPGDRVDVGLLAAEDLELVAAEGGDEEAQAHGLEHEELGEGGLEGGEVVLAVGAGEGEEGALQALIVEAGVAAAAGGGAGPGLELLRDLDEEGVADALVELRRPG